MAPRTMNTAFEVGTALVMFLLVGCQTPEPAPSPNGPTKIALLSDTHVTRGTRESQPLHAARFAKAVAAVNQSGADLVLIAGDLTENGKEEEWLDFRRQIRAFNAPVWFVPGNHDVGNKRVSGAAGEVTFGRVVHYELKFGRSYFERQHAGVRVLGVNSALFQSGLLKEKGLWRFLERALAQPSTQPTLLLTHHPLFVENPGEEGGGYWNVEPEARTRLLALLQQGAVAAVLSGHLHRPVTRRYEGILFFTTSPVAFGLPRDKEPQGWNLLTVSQDDIQAEFHEIVD